MRSKVRQREDCDDGDEGGGREREPAVEQTSKESQPSDEPSKHINFFQDVKKGVRRPIVSFYMPPNV